MTVKSSRAKALHHFFMSLRPPTSSVDFLTKEIEGEWGGKCVEIQVFPIRVAFVYEFPDNSAVKLTHYTRPEPTGNKLYHTCMVLT
jgi:hypothetical protein